MPGDDNLLPRLQRFAIPAGHSGHEIWAIELAVPLLDRAVFLLHVDENLDVRILEVKLGHHSIYGHQLSSVIARVAVMRKRTRRNRHSRHGAEDRPNDFHGNPQVGAFTAGGASAATPSLINNQS